jgi:heme exporter protein CcmD
MDLGRHAGFILASYGATVLILGGFVWLSAWRYADAKRRFVKEVGADNG